MPFDTYITNGSSVVFRKPKFEILSELFTNRQCSDIFLWSYLLEKSSFAFLNKNLNFFRRHEGSTSSFLQKNKLETIYHEKAKYLNYFEWNLIERKTLNQISISFITQFLYLVYF